VSDKESPPHAGDARFEKKILTAVPVDETGLEVDSWIYQRAPLTPGDTPPLRVIVVHGLGDAPVTWFPSLRHALPRHELLLPALPGAGRGPLPDGLDHLDFRRTAGWLAQVLGGLADETTGEVRVIGHSLGGWLVARALLSDPGLAARYGPPVLINNAGTWYEEVEQERHMLSPRTLEDVDELLLNLYARPPELPIEALQSLLETMRSPSYRGLLWSTTEEDFLRPADIARLPAGTALVWGVADGLVPPVALEALKEHLRAPRVTELAFCGHAPHLEAPRKLVEVLARLIP
jgi:pimeloyl-ACP methyl ester carboxylesterase